ncbi:MAG: DNA translocase FtsK 4TM domain-containing protein [Clostridia bacterium]|nr:DNA translocase FtsK 4TM domain-containing protein [Clostridia bacterium]
MAAKKGGRGRAASSKKGSSSAKPMTAAKKQAISVILFGISLFLLAVIIIKGENIWHSMHSFFFGLFGVLAYIFPVFLLIISVLFAVDKLNGKYAVRVAEGGILSLLVLATIDIFGAHPEGQSFTEHLTVAYKNGIELKSGGFFGALIGEPIHMAFGHTGAIVTVFLLIFIFLMLSTGTTLIALYRNISKPVKKIEQTVQETYKERFRRSDIDIPLDETPPTVEETANMSDKQRKVISAYRGEDIGEIVDDIPDESESITVEDALKAAKTEAKSKNDPASKQKRDEAFIETAEAAENIPMEHEDYKYPPIDLLKGLPAKSPAAEQAELESTAQRLVNALKSFGVETRIVDISRGPTVTRYELQPSAGVKISKITNLADDIALNLATAGVRIEAPIPNKAAVGIEVPNKASNVVHIREILESSSFTGSKSKLTMALGKDIGGNAIVGDIAKWPHGLIAGATGSGKSVCINSIIMSILYKAKPDEVKLIMIDPKVVELGIYNGIPHLLVPVVTDPRKAAGTLGWAVSEMEKRYKMFAASNVRDLDGFNRLAENDEDLQKLPRIVIIIDELADLMMTAPKEVEDSINRIAAKARAAGMHLIIATQRPSVDVVTGVIKANIPTRVAFAVSSQIDSRTILDHAGAEKLLGRGDMLYSPIGATKPSRIQGCFVSDEEVEAVTDFVKQDHTTEYDQEVMDEIERQAAFDKKDKGAVSSDGDDAGDSDPMLNAAIEVVVENGQASTSMLQRRLKLGYARAARLVDEMEERGIVGPYEGAKPRQVLITREQWMEQKAGEE